MNEKKQGNYGNTKDWASILSGAQEGASSALQGATAYANSKREAKEAKRRTLSNLMNRAMKRNQDLYRVNEENANEMTDYRSRALQEVAKGFIDSLRGS